MKRKVLFVLALAVIMSSCAKSEDNSPLQDWVCHCTITSSSGTHDVDIPQKGQTHSDATTHCTEAQTSYNTGGNSATCFLQ